MLNIPELYIIGEPIDTPLGRCRFFKVKEYDLTIKYQYILALDKNELLNKIYEEVKKGTIPEKDFDTLIDKDILQLIKMNIFGLYNLFKELFELLFDTSDIDKSIEEKIKYLKENKELCEKELVTLKNNQNLSNDELIKYNNFINELQKQLEELSSFKKLSVFDRIQIPKEFDEYCKLIKEMNCIKIEKSATDSELAYYDKLTQIIKEKKGEIITLKSMITSVGLYRQDVLEMSIYDLHEYFNRISCFKNFDSSIIFSTIPSEKPYKITSYWFTDTQTKKTKLTDEDKEMLNSHMGMVQGKHENGIKQDI
jgi:hypothetical protein